MTTLGTVEFWDSFHRREHTEWYLPVDVVVREVLCVHAELTAQLLRFATSQLASGGGSNGGPWEDAGRGQVSGSAPDSSLGVRVFDRRRSAAASMAATSSTPTSARYLGVMDSMRALYPGCEFIRSDARDAAEFPSQSFDMVIDKGMFDSATARTEGRVDTAKKLLDEAARVLATGGKYMIFSAFSNDELGHKDMADMLVHPGFGEQVQMRVIDTPPLEYPDQTSSYLYTLTKA